MQGISSPTRDQTHAPCGVEHVIDYTTLFFQVQYLTMSVIYLDQFCFFLFNKCHGDVSFAFCLTMWEKK